METENFLKHLKATKQNSILIMLQSNLECVCLLTMKKKMMMITHGWERNTEDLSPPDSK